MVCRLSLIKTYLLFFHVLRKFRDSAPLIMNSEWGRFEMRLKLIED